MIIGEAMKLIKIFGLPLAFFICMGAVQAKELSPRFVAADANKDEKLSKDEVVAFVVNRAEKRGEELFQKLDANNDSSVTKDEAKGKKMQKMGLINADTSDDGKLSKDEVVAFLEKKAEERAGKRFLQVDKNADGFVTPEEAKQAKQKEKKKEADDDTESEDEPL
jgi:Ca2+-binding EF-hand superfamily protein